MSDYIFRAYLAASTGRIVSNFTYLYNVFQNDCTYGAFISTFFGVGGSLGASVSFCFLAVLVKEKVFMIASIVSVLMSLVATGLLIFSAAMINDCLSPNTNEELSAVVRFMKRTGGIPYREIVRIQIIADYLLCISLFMTSACFCIRKLSQRSQRGMGLQDIW